jgi:uncharacterized phage infection (PIP) family protein YhgE
VQKVDAGARLVDEAGTTMKDIVASIARVTDIMAEITAASQEQTSGIEQVNQAITQMDQVTQQNASLVEQAAAASQSMQDEAGNLAKAVSVFKLDGRQTSVVAPAPAVRKPNVDATKAPARAIRNGPAKARMAVPAPQAKRIARPQPVAGGEWEEF